ncbi:MAG: DNA alkylation repair protein [Clostridia bacterium]|nr:DNA alkylation repair protein [Clostridia bacterium]
MGLNLVQKELFCLQDIGYKEFHSKLMPTVDKERVIGVRTPSLRKFAKLFFVKEEVNSFTADLPHYYYEENNLHAFLIEMIKDYNDCILALDRFLPFVDNWATCDMMNPKVLLANKSLLKNDLLRWLESDKTYVVRFAIVCSIRAFCEDEFNQEVANKIAAIKTDEYYVNSAIGWFFATLLTKNFDIGVKYIKQNSLNKTAHNLAVKKAIESLLISKDKKEYLKGFKIK